MRIGFVYNLRADFPDRLRTAPDSDFEWDDPSTIVEVTASLEEAGHEVVDLGDPSLLMEARTRSEIDLVFSICEMHGYRHRNALVPALCELLELPYVFSPPDVMVAALDKNLSNLLVRQGGGNVPDWTVAAHRDAALPAGDGVALILKPIAEGGGMGLDDGAVVHDEETARGRIASMLDSYRQPVLVQRYLPGRDVTVGIVETTDGPIALRPMEVRSIDGSVMEVYGHEQKENSEQLVRWSAVEDGPLRTSCEKLALLAFEVLRLRDGARIDLREGADGEVGFLEVNSLPHLHPVIGDFCRAARATGWSHARLLDELVCSAARRFGLTG